MFFKVIVVILGIYLLGKLIIKGFVSWFLGSSADRTDKQMRYEQESMIRKKKKKEGHVTVHYQPKSDKNFGKEDGDYVDFEEVK